MSPFAPLLSVPGWGPVRAGNYGGALGDPARFDNHRQVYRTAGLNPIQYESAGKRRDSVISREGSVELRRALIDLGLGLWLNDPAAKVYGAQLRGRGKKGLVIGCAMAHRANRIAFALVRDQSTYDPDEMDPGGLTHPFTTPVGSARLEGTKDPDQTPTSLWQTLQGVMPHLAWRPGPSPLRQPERSQTTRPTRRGRIRQRGRPAPDSQHPPTNKLLHQLRVAESTTHARPRT